MNPDVKEDMSSSKAQSALIGQIQWPYQTPPILVVVQKNFETVFCSLSLLLDMELQENPKFKL